MKFLLISLLGAFALLTFTAPIPAHAATILSVNAYNDLPDANPGDKTCQTKKKTCTLRAAVMESNAMCGGDYGCEETIILPKGTFTLTRVGADDNAFQGDLDITGNVTIKGAGAGITIIDGNSSVIGDRVFHLIANSSGVFVHFDGVTIANGESERGGGIYSQQANLELKSSQVIFSTSTHWGGGGVYSENATVDLKGSTIAENTSNGDFGFGAGIFLDGGYLYIADSALFENEGVGTYSNGGALYLREGQTVISNTIIDKNHSNEYGGAIRASSGSLTIQSSTISNNYAEVGGGGLFIDTDLQFLLEDSTVSDNAADINVGDYGGGMYIEGETTIRNSKILRNSAPLGGGIYKTGDPLTITGTSLDDNYASTSGGGIYQFWGVVDISSSSITRSHANDKGGGVYQYSGDLSLTNTTVSGNHANTQGGGIFVDGSALSPGAHVNTYNATIASNEAGIAKKGGGSGGGVFNSQGYITLQNTILADNIQYNSPTQEPNDCHGKVKSSGYSLIEVPGALCSLDSGPGDIVGQDPQLSALQGNQTEWHKIPLTSPAVEKANPNGCADANNDLLEEDQRGHKRHVNADADGVDQCDIGSYENGDAISPNP